MIASRYSEKFFATNLAVLKTIRLCSLCYKCERFVAKAIL